MTIKTFMLNLDEQHYNDYTLYIRPYMTERQSMKTIKVTYQDIIKNIYDEHFKNKIKQLEFYHHSKFITIYYTSN